MVTLRGEVLPQACMYGACCRLHLVAAAARYNVFPPPVAY